MECIPGFGPVCSAHCSRLKFGVRVGRKTTEFHPDRVVSPPSRRLPSFSPNGRRRPHPPPQEWDDNDMGAERNTGGTAKDDEEDLDEDGTLGPKRRILGGLRTGSHPSQAVSRTTRIDRGRIATLHRRARVEWTGCSGVRPSVRRVPSDAALERSRSMVWVATQRPRRSCHPLVVAMEHMWNRCFLRRTEIPVVPSSGRRNRESALRRREKDMKGS